MALANKAPAVSEERERQLLEPGTSSETVAESARVYTQKIQEESLAGLPEYLRYLYIAADYLGITSPDQRLSQKIRQSDQSCIKQRVMISQLEKKIRQHEQMVADKELELRDCILCYEKRKGQIEENVLRAEQLEEGRQEICARMQKNPADENSGKIVSKIDSEIIKANQDVRRYQREQGEFASRIIEAEAFIKESQNVLVSVQVYSSVLQKNYLRSRIERMRLAPLVGMGRKPLETIDLVVQDQKIAEETGRLADVMTSWVGELTEQMSAMEISPRQRDNAYSDLRGRYSSSNERLTSLAEKVIEEQRRPKYT